MSIPCRLFAAAFSLAAVIALALSSPFSPRPAPRYTVTDLGVLPGSLESWAMTVNSSGDVAGSVRLLGSRSEQAFVYHGSAMIRLGALPGASGSTARGINVHGAVTGTVNLLGAHHAFLSNQGKMRDIGTLPGFHGSEGVDINDRGEVAGMAAVPSLPGLTHEHAFIYRHGQMTDIGTPPGCSESQAASISAAGLIVGQGLAGPGQIARPCPFVYDSRTRTMTILPVPALYRAGWAYRANGRGQVIGSVWLPNNSYRAVFWQGGGVTELGNLPGFQGSVGMGLNNRGEAVGSSFGEGGPLKSFLRGHVGGGSALRRYLDQPSEHAFVYRAGKMQDLNDLIPAGAGWTLEDARAINDRGQIVGIGLHRGQIRGFLLTPLEKRGGVGS